MSVKPAIDVAADYGQQIGRLVRPIAQLNQFVLAERTTHHIASPPWG